MVLYIIVSFIFIIVLLNIVYSDGNCVKFEGYNVLYLLDFIVYVMIVI